MILWLSFKTDRFPKPASLWHTSWGSNVCWNPTCSRIPHAPASQLPPPISGGWVLPGWGGSHRLVRSAARARLPSFATPRPLQRVQAEGLSPASREMPAQRCTLPPPQSTAGIAKHTTALREDYDNSHKVVRANSVYNPLSLGQCLSLYCYFFFSAVFMQGSALNINDRKTIHFPSQLRWML